MIKYLGHEFECYDTIRYTHLDIFKCVQCNLRVCFYKKVTFNPDDYSIWTIPSFRVLELTCDETIIKGIIE